MLVNLEAHCARERAQGACERAHNEHEACTMSFVLIVHAHELVVHTHMYGGCCSVILRSTQMLFSRNCGESKPQRLENPKI